MDPETEAEARAEAAQQPEAEAEGSKQPAESGAKQEKEEEEEEVDDGDEEEDGAQKQAAAAATAEDAEPEDAAAAATAAASTSSTGIAGVTVAAAPVVAAAVAPPAAESRCIIPDAQVKSYPPDRGQRAGCLRLQLTILGIRAPLLGDKSKAVNGQLEVALEPESVTVTFAAGQQLGGQTYRYRIPKLIGRIDQGKSSVRVEKNCVKLYLCPDPADQAWKALNLSQEYPLGQPDLD